MQNSYLLHLEILLIVAVITASCSFFWVFFVAGGKGGEGGGIFAVLLVVITSFKLLKEAGIIGLVIIYRHHLLCGCFLSKCSEESARRIFSLQLY